jgi:hypothetical protein
MRSSCGPDTRWSTTSSIRRSSAHARDQACLRLVPGRADQRHHRVRGGGRARLDGRRQRGTIGCGGSSARASPGRSVPRCSRGRFGHEGDERAVSHVHLTRRIPASPRCRHRLPSSGASGSGDRPRLAVHGGCRGAPLGTTRAGERRLATETSRVRTGASTPTTCGAPRPTSRHARREPRPRRSHGRRLSHCRGRASVRGVRGQTTSRGRARSPRGCRAHSTGLSFRSLSGLSREVVEKLEAVRPETLGRAARIEGMTPAALALLAVHIEKRA